MAKVTAFEVAAYFAAHPTHTTKQAAVHFRVSDRWIRELKKQIGTPAAQAPDRPRLRVIERPPLRTPVPTYAPAQHPQSVFDQWQTSFAKCPHCGDLMHPLPDDTPESWEHTGCYLCRTAALKPLHADTPPQGADVPEVPEVPEGAPEVVPEVEVARSALQSHTSAAPEVPEVPAVLEALGYGSAQRTALGRAAIAPPTVRYIRVQAPPVGGLPWLLERVPGHVLLGLVVGVAIILVCAAAVR